MFWVPPAPAIIIPKPADIIRPGDPRFGFAATLPGIMGLAGKGGSAAVGGTTASNFLARTSGLDGTHTTAYTNLLNGLDTDGLTSKLDALWTFATQDAATAALNLMSTNFTATPSGSPTFTADRGYTGTSGSAGVIIDTGFNPGTATSPKYTQNSNHFSAWSVTNIGTDGHPIMGNVTSGVSESTIYPKFTDNNAYFRPNDGGTLAGVANSDSSGHYLVNRSTSTNVQGYRNGSSIKTSTTDNSAAVASLTFYVLGWHNSIGTPSNSGYQCGVASIGGSLSSTDASNFYTRLRTFMTAVGAP